MAARAGRTDKMRIKAEAEKAAKTALFETAEPIEESIS
jgi:hypothetical protein